MFLDLFRWLHILSGALALGSLALPLAATKGGRIHRAAGTLYVRAMGGVSATGVVLAVARLTDPATREGGVFLLFVALLAATTTTHGVAALRHKARSGPVYGFDTVVLPGLLVLAGALMVSRGLVTGSVLQGAFGAIGTWTGGTALLHWTRASRAPDAWLMEHIAGMFASGIGTVTAFVVVNAARLDLPVPGWVVWLAPTLLGVPALVYWQRRMRRPAPTLQRGT